MPAPREVKTAQGKNAFHGSSIQEYGSLWLDAASQTKVAVEELAGAVLLHTTNGI